MMALILRHGLQAACLLLLIIRRLLQYPIRIILKRKKENKQPQKAMYPPKETLKHGWINILQSRLTPAQMALLLIKSWALKLVVPVNGNLMMVAILLTGIILQSILLSCIFYKKFITEQEHM